MATTSIQPDKMEEESPDQDIQYVDTNVDNDPSDGLSACPGVCVAPGISDYCDAVLARPGLCKGALKCCVTREVFQGQDPPEDLILNDPPSTTPPVDEETVESGDGQEQPSPRPPPRRPPFRPIPEHLRCKGTCVGAFFTFLCDEIDRNAICPQGGHCCITRPQGATTRRPPSGAQPTTQPPTVAADEKEDQEKVPCRGRCVSSIMSAFCTAPSRVVPVSTCQEGTVCCEAPTRPPPPKRPNVRPPQRPQSSAGPLGTLLGLLAPSVQQRPPPPPPPLTTTSTTTTTTTTTEAPDPRAECPGTCITSFLSFTCFGNAEMTDLFKCPKKTVVCCAPKSAILELKNAGRIPAAGMPPPPPPPPPPMHHARPHPHPIHHRNDTFFSPPPYRPQQGFFRPGEPFDRLHSCI
ncbi:unnamed protein product [Darwinula stevensoni]|uniref:Protein masquerade clip-domain domain-containing protein n=1 Tax=Darwinula stevensoni TaxID=69355 RepID=A0A7R9AI64_9CRUS|nr:unnamed protein product [Darwinula stevensoni]CAG0906482.1 unnamed protein product [Darwinula stevensoni]